ncbi:MAG: hypothetical protein N2379_04945 [Verrucomicrobiae bacterium]|nr:hypothetical protein [Verrucomicrobiae bacterium]
MQRLSFDEVIEQILAKDKRYARDAYEFVREALDYTQKKLFKHKPRETPHVTGQELLEGIREFALQRFGPLTLLVFDEWGIRSTEDFGEIVFNMVDAGLLAKTEKDSRADFANGYDFDEAFRQPFLPSSKKSSKTPPPNSVRA